MKVFVHLLVALGAALGINAEDWPRWRGPDLNGISREIDWSYHWPKDGPRIAWKASVGTGFSSVSVSGNRLYTIGNIDNQDIIYCLDTENGNEVWRYSYKSDLGDKFFDGGPTSTPTVDNDTVYALSRWGLLCSLNAATGTVRWKKDLQQETGVRVPGWGFASSPLVADRLLLLNVGDAGMAVDKRDGQIVWQSSNKDAGYSSAIPFQNHGESFIALGSGKSYVAVNLLTGKELWRHRWVTRYGVNAADPIISGNRVFISTGYGKGAAMLEIGEGAPRVVWQNKDMRNQLNTTVLINGFLYGFDGDAGSRSSLKCISWDKGETQWNNDAIRTGGLTAAGNKLIILNDRGELMIADATPEEFRPSARAQVLGGKCWTSPVLSNGHIYCRNSEGDLVSVDVQKDPSTGPSINAKDSESTP